MKRRFTWPSTIGAADEGEAETKKFMEYLGFDEEAVSQTSYAVREAMTNAYRHVDVDNATITLELEQDDHRFVARIEDMGKKDLSVTEYIEFPSGLPDHRRGIALMNILTDAHPKVEYINRNGTRLGKRVVLVKYPVFALS